MQPQFHPPFLFHLLAATVRILLVSGAVFILLRYYLKHTRREAPAIQDNHGRQEVPAVGENEGRKIILPLRLQAYERFVLFLERIHPSNLLLRLNSPDITALQLQSLLVKTIREEFEYNLSQQLYISPGSWEMIRNAKEETISMINQATAKVGNEADSGELVRVVFEMTVSKGNLPVDEALREIKKEVQQFF